MNKQPKVPIYEETYKDWTNDCDSFKKIRGHNIYTIWNCIIF